MSRWQDLARRVGGLEERLTWLDEHGTRGVDAIRGQLTDQDKDIARVEASVGEIRATVEALRGNAGRDVRLYIIPLIPVYVLLALAVFHIHT